MPLPIGHGIIGITTHHTLKRDNKTHHWKMYAFIFILANIPDLDFLIGLILKNNANMIHRGPTHSLVFAILVGFLASQAHKLWSFIPHLKILPASLIVLSHSIGDAIFTPSPVSLLWPFDVSLATGSNGWAEILTAPFLYIHHDHLVYIICTVILTINFFIRKLLFPPPIIPKLSEQWVEKSSESTKIENND